MNAKIIQLHQPQKMDLQRDFYELPLDQRVTTYYALAAEINATRRKKLNPFWVKQQQCPDGKLTPTQLTSELRQIVPKFAGDVIGRYFDSSVALQYIITPQEMENLFGQSPFGNYTGKVIGTRDGLLAPKYRPLSGLVIVQAKQETEEKDWFIGMHEVAHSQDFNFPNAQRRDQYAKALLSRQKNKPEELMELLIGLDKAILIDEATACVNPYHLTDRPHTFRRDYVTEVKNSARNMLGFELSGLRNSGKLAPALIEKINKYEYDAMVFPSKVKQTAEYMAEKLINPEGDSDPLSYGLSYVGSALQILDFEEIPTLMSQLCVELLEPRRLQRIISFRGQMKSLI